MSIATKSIKGTPYHRSQMRPSRWCSLCKLGPEGRSRQRRDGPDCVTSDPDSQSTKQLPKFRANFPGRKRIEENSYPIFLDDSNQIPKRVNFDPRSTMRQGEIVFVFLLPPDQNRRVDDYYLDRCGDAVDTEPRDVPLGRGPTKKQRKTQGHPIVSTGRSDVL